MRRTLYAIAALAFITLAACNKNDDEDDTVLNNLPDVGTLRFKNVSGDLYDFYLDDVKFGNLYGGDSATFPNITAVGHRVKAIQIEHINGTATLRQQIIYVPKDSLVTFVFP